MENDKLVENKSEEKLELSDALLLIASRIRAPGSVNLIDLLLNEIEYTSLNEDDVSPVRQYLLDQLQSSTPSPTKTCVKRPSENATEGQGILELIFPQSYCVTGASKHQT